MNPIVEEIVKNAHLLVEKQYEEPITKTNPYLYNVSHLCITNRELMGRIPAEDAGYLGFAYMNILSLTEDTSVHQIYSSICFYYNEKALIYAYAGDRVNSQMHVQTLNDSIILMNIGARSLCRTFAQAQGVVPSNYINFNNLHALPSYVKQILLCEYSYFIEFEKALATKGINIGRDPQMSLRYNFINDCVNRGYFQEFGQKEQLCEKAKQIRKIVYHYAASKLEKGDIVFV